MTIKPQPWQQKPGNGIQPSNLGITSNQNQDTNNQQPGDGNQNHENNSQQ